MKHNFKPYINNNIFIETGTFTGKGVDAAIDAGFKKIISIELSEYFFLNCKKKFKNNKNVELYLGDSSKLLPNILDKINEPITFWLDGHWSGGNTACGDKPVPLYDELMAIKSHPIKTHTILIDDIRLVKSKANEFKDIEFDFEGLKKIIKSINKNYEISFLNGRVDNDILVAKIK
jgi:predicted nucleic-acid-binding Zn-ribbon protein